MKHFAVTTRSHSIDEASQRGCATLDCADFPDWWCDITVKNLGGHGVCAAIHSALPPTYDSPEILRPAEGQLRLCAADDIRQCMGGLFRVHITRDMMSARALAWTQFCRESFGGPDCWVRQIMQQRSLDSLVLVQHVDEPDLPDCITKALPWVITQRSPEWVGWTLES